MYIAKGALFKISKDNYEFKRQQLALFDLGWSWCGSGQTVSSAPETYDYLEFLDDSKIGWTYTPNFSAGFLELRFSHELVHVKNKTIEIEGITYDREVVMKALKGMRS